MKLLSTALLIAALPALPAAAQYNFTVTVTGLKCPGDAYGHIWDRTQTAVSGTIYTNSDAGAGEVPITTNPTNTFLNNWTNTFVVQRTTNGLPLLVAIGVRFPDICSKHSQNWPVARWELHGFKSTDGTPYHATNYSVMPSSDCDISHGMRAGILEGANSYSIDPVFFTSEGPIWPELLPPFGPRVFPGDMGPPTYPGGWFKEEFVGEPLATFTIVSAPSLSSTWTFRTNVTSDIYGRAEFTLATGGSNNLFYRTTVTNVP